MLHAKFRENRPAGSGEDFLKFRSPLSKEAPHKIWV